MQDNTKFWSDKRVCVTGGSGFLGSYIVAALERHGCPYISIPRSTDYDLRDRAAVRQLYADSEPDVVIHAAGVVGGIGANIHNPGRFFYDNLMMGAHVVDEAKERGLKKLVVLGTICAYPKFTPVPFREADLWVGYPEETNAPYGIAKKALLVQAQAYRQQYGLDAIYLLPVNLYGPRDNFDPASSHVIPALIKKCVDAMDQNHDQLEVWGSGNQTREFLYAEDCAEGILLATEKYSKSEPVNLGNGREVPMRELVSHIVRLTGFQGAVVWDTSKPDGQPRRCLDTSRAEQEFGFRAKTSLEDGLRSTIDWYLETRRA